MQVVFVGLLYVQVVIGECFGQDCCFQYEVGFGFVVEIVVEQGYVDCDFVEWQFQVFGDVFVGYLWCLGWGLDFVGVVFVLGGGDWWFYWCLGQVWQVVFGFDDIFIFGEQCCGIVVVVYYFVWFVCGFFQLFVVGY